MGLSFFFARSSLEFSPTRIHSFAFSFKLPSHYETFPFMALQSKIKALENKISKDKDKLANLRRKAPLEPVTDYFVWNGKKKVKLSSLFRKKKEMILIHNMGSDCPYCALWDLFDLLPETEWGAKFQYSKS